MRSVEFQVTPSHFKSSPTSFRLPIFLYLLSNEFMEIGFWELKWQFLYHEIHSKSCDEKFLLSKINHLSIYQVPKDTKLETRLDVSKVIRVKREMMSLDKVGIHGKCNQYVPLDLLQIRANNNAPPCHRQVLQLYRDLCLSIR